MTMPTDEELLEELELAGDEPPTVEPTDAPDTPDSGAAEAKPKRSHRSRAERVASGELPPPPEGEGPPPPRRRGGLLNRGPKVAKPKPVRKAKRQSAADVFEWAYGTLGRVMEATPYYPAGRMMQWQASAAGVILDEAVDGTALDTKLVQPALGAADRFEAVGYLLAPPLLMAMASRSPESRERLEPVIKLVLRESLVRMAPAIRKARERAEKEREAVADLFGDGMLGPNEDPVEHLFQELFSWPTEPANAGGGTDDGQAV